MHMHAELSVEVEVSKWNVWTLANFYTHINFLVMWFLGQKLVSHIHFLKSWLKTPLLLYIALSTLYHFLIIDTDILF